MQIYNRRRNMGSSFKILTTLYRIMDFNYIFNPPQTLITCPVI